MMLEVAHARGTLDRLREVGVPAPVPWCYAWLAEHWINFSDGERVGMGLVTVPVVRLFMVKHFIHHPLSGRSYTMLTSAFSHMVSLFHRIEVALW